VQLAAIAKHAQLVAPPLADLVRSASSVVSLRHLAETPAGDDPDEVDRRKRDRAARREIKRVQRRADPLVVAGILDEDEGSDESGDSEPDEPGDDPPRADCASPAPIQTPMVAATLEVLERALYDAVAVLEELASLEGDVAPVTERIEHLKSSQLTAERSPRARV
jgi:hypothetical protein